MQEGGRREQRQHAHQRVHPRLLRVAGEERVERAERRADQPGAPAEQAPAAHSAARDREQRDQRPTVPCVSAGPCRRRPSRRAAACSRAAASRPAAARPGCRRAAARRSRSRAPRPSRATRPATRAQVDRDGEQHEQRRRREHAVLRQRAELGQGTGAASELAMRRSLVRATRSPVGARARAASWRVGAVSARPARARAAPARAARGRRRSAAATCRWWPRAGSDRRSAWSRAGRRAPCACGSDPRRRGDRSSRPGSRGCRARRRPSGSGTGRCRRRRRRAARPCPPARAISALEVVPELRLVLEPAAHACRVVGLVHDRRRGHDHAEQQRRRP